MPESAGSAFGDEHSSQISPLTPLSKEPTTSGSQREEVKPQTDVSEPTTPVKDEEDDEGREEKADGGQEVEEENEDDGIPVDGETPRQAESHDDNHSEQQSRESTPAIRTRRKGAPSLFERGSKLTDSLLKSTSGGPPK